MIKIGQSTIPLIHWIETLATLFTFFGLLYAFYAFWLKPRKLKTKLQTFLQMLEEWYDEIDKNLNSGLSLDVLGNQEDKIHEFIRLNLRNYRIKPTPAIIRKWNKEMGLKTELLDSKDSFHKSSRIHVDGMPVDLFFTMLVANFCKFHTNYPPKETGACNFAEIQMPIKFFRFYLEELGHGG